MSERCEAVARYFDEPSGYRLPETDIGWQAFLRAPVAGHGLGHVVADQPVAGMGTIDVRPTYHAYYITLLANAGLAGTALLAWPLVAALRRRPGDSTVSIAARALLWGSWPPRPSPHPPAVTGSWAC